jgi:hypothetical protein
MLNIRTFDTWQGGNVLYKALAHPLAAEAITRLYGRLKSPLAVFDPDGAAEALFAMHPNPPEIVGRYVQDVRHLIGGARPLADLAESGARAVLIAAFNAGRISARLAALLPGGVEIVSLDDARIPDALLTNPRTYLDKLNFATNFAFFREQDGFSTRLVTANYWSGYGQTDVRLWLRLFDADGRVLASWEEAIAPGPGGIAIDSATVRERFGLPEFAGQLFIHVVGAAGHDVVKYAIDTYGNRPDVPSLSCTHDANAWPSDRYAGLPAPVAGERVVLWLQNSHAAPIPPGAIQFDRMGAEQPVTLQHPVPPFASVALDVARLLPDVQWPAQIELRSGRHIVRPRYEITRMGRTRIAHMNVERADLQPDPGIKTLSPLLGRGYLLPFPILPCNRFRTIVQPNPMAETQHTLPLRIDVFDMDGRKVGEKFLGCLKRDHALALTLDDFECEAGHAELVYDFHEGGEADGWMHAIARYEDRFSGHVAETSFGAHLYNTLMTYRDEPQSYSGPPPGLSTRLFLKLGDARRRSFAHLIYPASAAWLPRSGTTLLLHDSAGQIVAEEKIAIPCCGSATVFPDDMFGEALVTQAGPRGYVLIRDATCRLFGYHGLMDDQGGFSLDHMFGF